MCVHIMNFLKGIKRSFDALNASKLFITASSACFLFEREFIIVETMFS